MYISAESLVHSDEICLMLLPQNVEFHNFFSVTMKYTNLVSGFTEVMDLVYADITVAMTKHNGFDPRGLIMEHGCM